MFLKVNCPVKIILFLILKEIYFIKLTGGNIITATVDINGKREFHPGLSPEIFAGNKERKWIASSWFLDTIQRTGWSYFEVETNPELDDERQAYEAGYMEGSTTRTLIYKHWKNTVRTFCGNNRILCKNINKFLDTNTAWARAEARLHSKYNPTWHHVNLFYIQLDGIFDGYNEIYGSMASIYSLEWQDILWLNVGSELQDLVEALSEGNVSKRVLGLGSCSAAIKLVTNTSQNSSLFVGHNSCSQYSSMLRMAKRYKLPLRTSGKSPQLAKVFGWKTTFSSYPGAITSGDDFYIINPSGLVVTQTDLGIANRSRWIHTVPTYQLIGAVRITLANRFSNNGRAWCETFAVMNSGTHNSQWMVVDYNRFTSGQEPEAGLLWVLEQIPGHIKMEDKTDVLLETGYWASYNVPYFTEIFNLSGNQALVEKYGDWFTYEGAPRGRIFERDQNNVTDMESMYALMRSNDFRHDTLSLCNACNPPYSAENAIAPRNDLNSKTGVYPFPALGHRAYGATDTKVTSSAMYKLGQFMGISGPTLTSDLAPFNWNLSDFATSVPHTGHPQVWHFSPEIHTWHFV